MRCCIELHSSCQNAASLRELAVSYSLMGEALRDSGQPKEALFYYEKYLKGWEKLHESWQSEYSLYNFFLGFEVMENGFRAWGKWEEAV